jgi:oxygen-dependent protoporphyrinogen oxidase
MRSPGLGRRDDAGLLAVVQGELAHLLGVRAAPVYTHVRRWPRAIPQYTVGYERYKALYAQIEATAPGLFFGGNSRDGISLANCIASGRRLALTAAAHGPVA